MINLKQKSILFCGKERRFKRCPQKVLRDATKDAEKILKDMAEKTRDYQKLVQDSLELKNKLDNIKTDKEAKKLENQLKKHEDMLEKTNNEMQEYIKNADLQLIEEYGKVCVLLLEDITVDEFMQNYDSIDIVIAENINAFYDMCMSGFPENKIEGKLRELVENKHKVQSFR